MPRTKHPSLKERVKKSIADKAKDQEEQWTKQNTARRQAQGKKFCPNRLRGLDKEDPACDTCRDKVECLYDTEKRLVSVEDNLLKVFRESGSEDWASVGTGEIDLKEKRDWIIKEVQQLMQEAGTAPELIERIQALRPSTHRCLDELVPGWKTFRREIVEQKPSMAPEEALSRLGDIWTETADAAKTETGQSDPLTAWDELVSPEFFPNDYAAPCSKIIRELDSRLAAYRDALRNTFPSAFKKDKDEWPRKWMQNNKKIREMLSKRSLFVPLLNHLTRQTLSLQASKDLAERIGAGQHGEGQPFVMLRGVDPESIGAALGAKGPTVKKYLLALCRIGVLKNFSRSGRNGFSEYAIGYWSFRKAEEQWEPRRRWFLTNTPEMQEALATFDPYARKS